MGQGIQNPGSAGAFMGPGGQPMQPMGAPRGAPARQPAASPAQQAPQQQPQQQAAGNPGLMDFLTRLGIARGMPGVWGQQAMAGGMIGAAGQNALGQVGAASQNRYATDYAADAQLQASLAQTAAGTANQALSSVNAGQASMYGADQNRQAQQYAAYAPAQASQNIAPINANAAIQQQRMASMGQQNIAQLQAEQKMAALSQILGVAGPMFQGMGQGAPAPMGISTDFGGGVSYG